MSEKGVCQFQAKPEAAVDLITGVCFEHGTGSETKHAVTNQPDHAQLLVHTDSKGIC